LLSSRDDQEEAIKKHEEQRTRGLEDIYPRGLVDEKNEIQKSGGLYGIEGPKASGPMDESSWKQRLRIGDEKTKIPEVHADS
jgi:hypothetical protein